MHVALPCGRDAACQMYVSRFLVAKVASRERSAVEQQVRSCLSPVHGPYSSNHSVKTSIALSACCSTVWQRRSMPEVCFKIFGRQSGSRERSAVEQQVRSCLSPVHGPYSFNHSIKTGIALSACCSNVWQRRSMPEVCFKIFGRQSGFSRAERG